MQPNDLALAFGVCGHSDYRRDRDDAAALALLEVGGIEPEIRPFAGQRAVEERIDAIVDVPAQLADRALADSSQSHRLHHVVHPPGRDAADPGPLHHRDQPLLGGAPRLPEWWEITALTQLGDSEFKGAEPGLQRP